MYESADQSWRGRPASIPSGVVSRAALRIAEHAKTHELDRVEVVLHGGEPLLAGVAGLRAVLVELENALNGVCRLDVKIHTNGVLLNEKFCELFSQHGVGVGISVDGDRTANDRHRKYRDGRSSYDAVVRAIRLLSGDRFRHLYSGLLCTIDIANDPIRVYESLLELNPSRLDLLLPHATWDAPPPRTAGSGTEYADWLIAIFDRWQADGYPVRIRTFDSIVATLAGGDSATEAIGLAPVRMVVIETDGTYEQADSLKVAYDGAPATGLDVFSHSLDSALEHPGIVARQRGVADLSAACQRCPVVSSCGGGMYAHRYKSGSGFDNPSVYCDDLLKLISHISARLPHVAGNRPPAGQVLGEDAVAELASGLGGAEAIGQLRLGQLSLQRGLPVAVYEAGLSAPAVPPPTRDLLRTAWLALALADRDGSDAVNAVLGHPYLRAWAVRCLGRLGRGDPGGSNADRSLAADLGHLGAVAAVAAIRGRARARLTVPVIDGSVHLPGLGRLTVGGADGETQAVLEIEADWVRVRLGADGWRLPRPSVLAGDTCPAEPCTPDGAPALTDAARPAVWDPVRVLTAPGIRVTLEDTDPYRDCYQWPAAPRLTDQEFARWQRTFGLAWREIQEYHPAYAPALAVGLTALTPIVPTPVGADVTVAARQGFGAVGTALPDSPATLALLLIREFQRVKLAAVLDRYDLFDPADNRLVELLDGAYANLAVTEFWRVRAGLGQHDRAEAAERYQYWRENTAAAIKTVAGSSALTPLGRHFVGQMRNAIAVSA
ncbi:MAG TPA: FxsB family cyclophane-forming radical SAM/SPASM peptide maturase [Trebonia sp.]